MIVGGVIECKNLKGPIGGKKEELKKFGIQIKRRKASLEKRIRGDFRIDQSHPPEAIGG